MFFIAKKVKNIVKIKTPLQISIFNWVDQIEVQAKHTDAISSF